MASVDAIAVEQIGELQPPNRPVPNERLFFSFPVWNLTIGSGVKLDRALLPRPKIVGNCWRSVAQVAIMAPGTANLLLVVGRTMAIPAAYTFAAGKSVVNSPLRNQKNVTNNASRNRYRPHR